MKKLFSAVRFTFCSAKVLVKIWSSFGSILPDEFQEAIIRRLCIASNIEVPEKIVKHKPRGGEVEGRFFEPVDDVHNLGILMTFFSSCLFIPPFILFSLLRFLM